MSIKQDDLTTIAKKLKDNLKTIDKIIMVFGQMMLGLIILKKGSYI
jgi:hypothetical protein